MRVFTRPHMKPLHHVHSLSICCVPATLLCPRFMYITYQLTYHHKCIAYQHLCHFMYMNQKAHISTDVPPQVHSASTPMSLHVHEPKANISTHVPPQVHSISTPMSLHEHEPKASISTHIPPQLHSVSKPM